MPSADISYIKPRSRTVLKAHPAGRAGYYKVIDQHEPHWTTEHTGVLYRELPRCLCWFPNWVRVIALTAASCAGYEYLAKNGMWVDPTTGHCSSQTQRYASTRIGKIIRWYRGHGNALDS